MESHQLFPCVNLFEFVCDRAMSVKMGCPWRCIVIDDKACEKVNMCLGVGGSAAASINLGKMHGCMYEGGGITFSHQAAKGHSFSDS